jgi:carbon storage regulator
MLVLTRRKGESIMIGDDIELVVVEIKGDQVRLGVKAPKHVEVYRNEVFEAISEANKEASLVTVKPEEISKMFKGGTEEPT